MKIILQKGQRIYVMNHDRTLTRDIEVDLVSTSLAYSKYIYCQNNLVYYLYTSPDNEI